MRPFPYLAAASAAFVVAGQAAAQTRTVESSPFVIHEIAADPTVRNAKKGEPLLVQPVTASRAARLEVDAPTLFKSKTQSFAAGTAMFGSYDEATGRWLWCAVAESKAKWWAGDEFACYEDLDADGRFDTVRPSGAPFLGVPLFVFSPGAAKPLPTPVPYSRIDFANGPKTEYALSWRADRPRAKADQPAPKVEAIAVTPAMGPNASPIGSAATVKLDGQETGRVFFRGAEIEILGFEPDGSVRYRVLKGLPRQVGRVTMTMTTSYTTVPIYIPG